MRNSLWLLLLVPLLLFAAEPQVGSDTGRKTTTQKERTISREKSIDINKTKSISERDVLEIITNRSYSKDELNQFAMSSDMSGYAGHLSAIALCGCY
jgi:hypothetical protein